MYIVGNSRSGGSNEIPQSMFESRNKKTNVNPCKPRFYFIYPKVPKFSDARKVFCNLPKIQEKRPNLRVFHSKDADGLANSEDPDQTAPLGAV